MMKQRIVLTLLLILSATLANAATYHIDYAGGNDEADGGTPATAWKHSPGDRQATGNPGAHELKPGDVLKFKGGVQYYGEIRLDDVKGAKDRPIVLDGNTDGGYGKGRAILDGAKMVTGWQKVSSAEQVGGNPKWNQILYADVDMDLTSNFSQDRFVKHRDAGRKGQAPWQRLFLIDGEERVLPIAQRPKPKDSFFPDLPRDFYTSPVTFESGKKEGGVIQDPERINLDDPDGYNGMFVGLHGGNNHVYFAKVRGYDPDTNSLKVPHFAHRIYDVTRYAFFNSPRLIDLPGEWCLEPLDGGGTRIYFMPEDASGGQPENIGYPTLTTAVAIVGASSHIKVRGFLMQRYAGGQGGVGVNRRDGDRPSDIHIADCEIRFISGQSGISLNHSDNVTVENCYVHHCPGWTVGIYVNRVTGYNLLNTRVDYNSGSGIRHYVAKQGVLKNNIVINHFGMHSSGINFYEGSRDILFEGNFVENTIAINRSAENLLFRNNVVDSMGRNPIQVAMWVTGQVGGTHLKNLVFENNTFVNPSTGPNWFTAIFSQSGASKPEGLVARNNILTRLRPPFPGTVEGNIYMYETAASVAGSDSMVVSDPHVLFIDPENDDYRRKPGGPKMDAGANVPPPPDAWSPQGF